MNKLRRWANPFERERREVWIRTYCAAISAGRSWMKAEKIAGYALMEFDKRFPSPLPEDER